jgi:hypothetical protein
VAGCNCSPILLIVGSAAPDLERWRLCCTLGEMVSTKVPLVTVCRGCSTAGCSTPRKFITCYGEEVSAIELRKYAAATVATAVCPIWVNLTVGATPPLASLARFFFGGRSKLFWPRRVLITRLGAEPSRSGTNPRRKTSSRSPSELSLVIGPSGRGRSPAAVRGLVACRGQDRVCRSAEGGRGTDQPAEPWRTSSGLRTSAWKGSDPRLRPRAASVTLRKKRWRCR